MVIQSYLQIGLTAKAFKRVERRKEVIEGFSRDETGRALFYSRSAGWRETLLLFVFLMAINTSLDEYIKRGDSLKASQAFYRRIQLSCEKISEIDR